MLKYSGKKKPASKLAKMGLKEEKYAYIDV